MSEKLRSFLFRYGMAVLAAAALVGIALGLRAYSINLNFTFFIAVAIFAVSWFAGRGPGFLLIGLIVAATAALSTPTPDRSILRVLFGYFSAVVLLGPVVWLVSGRKITERKLREQHALLEETVEREQAARREAEEASKLKDEFLATVSHELRTPLNAILGWAEMLRHGAMSPDETANALDVIRRNARLQNGLIADILDSSRIVTGKMRIDFARVDLVPVMNEAIEAIEPARKAKSIDLATDFPDSGVLVNGDAGRLQQVFWNLLSNAVKFTPAGGRIEIAIAKAGTQIDVSVSDTGIGIEDDFLPYVFDAFRQIDSSTRRVHGGLGLGLSIVRSLVELHGGAVRVASGGGREGSTFMVTLPAAEGAIAASPAAAVTKGSDLKGTRVLVVDDEPDTLEMLAIVMENFGAQVLTASSSAEGIEAFTNFAPDVIVSDIGMPGEDGLDMIRKIRSLPAGALVPAAALTAYVSEADRQNAIAAGFQVHIPKPIEPQRLAEAVYELYRSRSEAAALSEPADN